MWFLWRRREKSHDFFSLVSCFYLWMTTNSNLFYSNFCAAIVSIWEREKKQPFFIFCKSSKLEFQVLEREKLVNASFTLIKHLKHLNFYSILKCFPQTPIQSEFKYCFITFPIHSDFSHFLNGRFKHFKRCNGSVAWIRIQRQVLLVHTHWDWLIKIHPNISYRMHTYWIHILLDGGERKKNTAELELLAWYL